MGKNSNDTFEGITMFILFLLLYPLAPLLFIFWGISSIFSQKRLGNPDEARKRKENLPKERIVYYVDGVERIFCR